MQAIPTYSSHSKRGPAIFSKDKQLWDGQLVQPHTFTFISAFGSMTIIIRIAAYDIHRLCDKSLKGVKDVSLNPAKHKIKRIFTTFLQHPTTEQTGFF